MSMHTNTKFLTAVEAVLKLEGGLVDHSQDPGGITNYGISLRFLKGLSNDLQADFNNDGGVDAEDIRTMSRDDAKKLYYTNWWEKNNYDRIIDVEVATKVLDMSVNMGAHQAHLLVQRSCRGVGTALVDDGILGSKSISVINSSSKHALLAAMKCTQAGFYYALVMRNSALIKKGIEVEDFSVFLEGWLARAYS